MNTSNLSLANRKQLADVLGTRHEGLCRKALEAFGYKRDRLYSQIKNEFIKQRKADKTVEMIEQAEQNADELRAELLPLGFSLDSDHSLCVVRHGALERLIDDRIEKEIGTESDILARFDSARVAMMTVATLEDADKILKSVSAIK